MSLFKCSFVLLLIISTQAYAERFTSNECLRSKYEASVEHDGKFFGLIKNKLDIKKEECLIEVTFKNILETKWVVDLCREPIHMKIHAKGSESVYKRNGRCELGDQSDFCAYWKELNETLQDYGLIFAKGERESLTTDHGKTYCAYLLLRKHLDDGILFSKYRPSVELFERHRVIDRKAAEKVKSTKLKQKDAIDTKTSASGGEKESPSSTSSSEKTDTTRKF